MNARFYHTMKNTYEWRNKSGLGGSLGNDPPLCGMQKNFCLYSWNNVKFGQLILSKIVTTVTTRCQILRQKNPPNSISAGALRQNLLGELTLLPRTLDEFKGDYSWERAGGNWSEGEWTGGKRTEGGEGWLPLVNPKYATDHIYETAARTRAFVN